MGCIHSACGAAAKRSCYSSDSTVEYVFARCDSSMLSSKFSSLHHSLAARFFDTFTGTWIMVPSLAGHQGVLFVKAIKHY